MARVSWEEGSAHQSSGSLKMSEVERLRAEKKHWEEKVAAAKQTTEGLFQEYLRLWHLLEVKQGRIRQRNPGQAEPTVAMKLAADEENPGFQATLLAVAADHPQKPEEELKRVAWMRWQQQRQ